jgi:hypothetical protein
MAAHALYKTTNLLLLFLFLYAASASRHSWQNDTFSTVPSVGRLAQVASEEQVKNAREIVNAELQKWAAHNKARFEEPLRNKYILKNEQKAPKFLKRGVPSIEITEEIAAAAALVAEMDALQDSNSTSPNLQTHEKRQASNFWMEKIARHGTQPYGNDAGYEVSTSSA